MICLDKYPGRLAHSSWHTIKTDKGLFIAWINPTPVSNTEYWRCLTVNFQFPFFRWVSSFVTDDGINEDTEVHQ